VIKTVLQIFLICKDQSRWLFPHLFSNFVCFERSQVVLCKSTSISMGDTHSNPPTSYAHSPNPLILLLIA
jgi:hypothetical protein